MHLFLTSSCISENLREPFLKFLGKPPQDVRCYFIPTASDVEDGKEWIVKSMDDLAAVGLNPIWYPLRFKSHEQVTAELADADLIWVNGGNTFYLLDVARRCGFMDVVNDLVVSKGVKYGGVSAGTILASPTIEAAGWEALDGDENVVGLKDLTSFGFVDFVTHVHYQPEQERPILDALKRDVLLYAIEDGSALEVQNDKVIIHGTIEIID